MCDDGTFSDCMAGNTIGFTESAAKQLERVATGAAAFLYNTKSKVLFGPFKVEAILAPDDRDTKLWGADNPRFPHQVRRAAPACRAAPAFPWLSHTAACLARR